MSRRRQDKDVLLIPSERTIVPQNFGNPDVLGNGIEVVAHVIEMKHAPVSPEVLRISEQVALVGRHRNGNRTLRGFKVTLALIAMVVGVKNPVHLGDSQAGEVVKNLSRTKIDDQPMIAGSNQVDIAGVFEQIQIV